jgi:hypothetical protein
LSRGEAGESGAAEPCRSILQVFSEVQRMSLIILDDKLARSPRGLMDLLLQMHSIALDHLSHSHDVIAFEVQMKVIAIIHERDRRILFVGELEMKYLAPSTNTGIEIIVLKLERAFELRGIEANRLGEVRRPQLGNDIRYGHCTSIASISGNKI